MKGSIQKLSIGGYGCSLYLPPGYEDDDRDYPVIYINGETDLNEILNGVEPYFGVECEKFICLGIQAQSWEYSFTPWPAPALSKKGGPFGGGAVYYLNSLECIIKPFLDFGYRTRREPGETALIGYSLAGLASLYALYTSSLFGRIGSLSGSLWYDGWIDFMASHMPVESGAKVYLSLGSGEENVRNQRMALVGDCTRKASQVLAGQIKPEDNLKLEWNNGGHFHEIPDRFKKAILWLMR